jgi:hypothetical protein
MVWGMRGSRDIRRPGVRAQHKATHITVMCKDCRSTKVLPCKPGIGGAMLPRYCDARSVSLHAAALGLAAWRQAALRCT